MKYFLCHFIPDNPDKQETVIRNCNCQNQRNDTVEIVLYQQYRHFCRRLIVDYFLLHVTIKNIAKEALNGFIYEIVKPYLSLPSLSIRSKANTMHCLINSLRDIFFILENSSRLSINALSSRIDITDLSGVFGMNLSFISARTPVPINSTGKYTLRIYYYLYSFYNIIIVFYL